MIHYPDTQPQGCYVYQFTINDVPRYVGKGTGDRYTRHEREAAGTCSRTPWHNHLRKSLAVGRTIRVDILADGLDDAGALALEIETIAQHGRRIGGGVGTLLNVLPGGDGLDSAAAAVIGPRVSATKSRPEAKAKTAAQTAARWREPGYRAKVSAAARAANTRPEVKAKRVAASMASNARPEVKAMLSVAAKARWADPEHTEKRVAALAAARTPEVRAKQAATIKATLARPEMKAKISAARTAMHARATPEQKAKRADGIRTAKLLRGAAARHFGVPYQTIPKELVQEFAALQAALQSPEPIAEAA